MTEHLYTSDWTMQPESEFEFKKEKNKNINNYLWLPDTEGSSLITKKGRDILLDFLCKRAFKLRQLVNECAQNVKNGKN